MSIVEWFDAAVADEAAAYPEPELLPVRLAIACVRVLPVAGAGLSALAHPDLRLPIGASDDVAGYVERLQFTHGEGPCLTAYATGEPQLITAGELQQRWPELHRDLTAVTPFRAVACIAITGRVHQDRCSRSLSPEPEGLQSAELENAITVAHCVSVALVAARLFTAAAQQADPLALPHGGHTAPMAGRVQVWKAMGLLNVHLQITAPDALALLRAHAYASDRLVDDLAHDIVTNRVPLDDLRP